MSEKTFWLVVGAVAFIIFFVVFRPYIKKRSERRKVRRAVHYLKSGIGRFEDVMMIERYVIAYGESHDSLGTSQDQVKAWYAQYELKRSDVART